MKTTLVTSLFAAVLSIALAAPATAAPASKHIGSSASTGASSTKGAVPHKVMRHIGPQGKGYACNH